jgi:GTPase SAR1 family protein
VFDVTSQATFDALRTWAESIRMAAPDVTIAIFGNKMDLPDHCADCIYLEGSAKLGVNVRDALGTWPND